VINISTDRRAAGSEMKRKGAGMSNIITTKSPVFWVIVFGGAVLPALGLRGIALAVTTLLVVAFVVTGIVRARQQQQRAVAEQS
jgi:hypothetical protein